MDLDKIYLAMLVWFEPQKNSAESNRVSGSKKKKKKKNQNTLFAFKVVKSDPKIIILLLLPRLRLNPW